jgi:hypothetical protein
MNPTKNNIRVFCRVRDINEGCGEGMITYNIEDTVNRISINSKSMSFMVDKLFVKASQEDIYEISVKPMLKNLFDGYNCTVFTYGQTGSGTLSLLFDFASS